MNRARPFYTLTWAFLGIFVIVSALVGLLTPAHAQAAQAAPQPLNVDLPAFLRGLAQTVIDFVLKTALPTALVGWVIDRLTAWLPFISPFRDMIRQFVLGKLETIKIERAKTQAVQSGAAMQAQLSTLSNTSPSVIKAAKLERDVDAQSSLVLKGVARDTQEAGALLHVAVSELKRDGVNP